MKDTASDFEQASNSNAEQNENHLTPHTITNRSRSKSLSLSPLRVILRAREKVKWTANTELASDTYRETTTLVSLSPITINIPIKSFLRSPRGRRPSKTYKNKRTLAVARKTQHQDQRGNDSMVFPIRFPFKFILPTDAPCSLNFVSPGKTCRTRLQYEVKVEWTITPSTRADEKANSIETRYTIPPLSAIAVFEVSGQPLPSVIDKILTPVFSKTEASPQQGCFARCCSCFTGGGKGKISLSAQLPKSVLFVDEKTHIDCQVYSTLFTPAKRKEMIERFELTINQHVHLSDSLGNVQDLKTELSKRVFDLDDTKSLGSFSEKEKGISKKVKDTYTQLEERMESKLQTPQLQNSMNKNKPFRARARARERNLRCQQKKMKEEEIKVYNPPGLFRCSFPFYVRVPNSKWFPSFVGKYSWVKHHITMVCVANTDSFPYHVRVVLKLPISLVKGSKSTQTPSTSDSSSRKKRLKRNSPPPLHMLPSHFPDNTNNRHTTTSADVQTVTLNIQA